MSSKKFIFFAFFCILLCATEYIVIKKHLPTEGDSRNILLTNYLNDKSNLIKEITLISPSEFCQKWTGLSLEEIDCQTGRVLKTQEIIYSEQANHLLPSTIEQILKFIEEAELVKKSMLVQLEKNQKLIPIIQALDYQISKQKSAIEAIKKTENHQQFEINNENYRIIFRALLDIKGQNYIAVKGNFKEKHWHIAQMFFNKNYVTEQGDNLKKAINSIPWVIIISTFLIICFSYWRLEWSGVIVAIIYIALNVLGILITADAAFYFGENSIYFPLNPFSNQLYRQLIVVSIGFGFILTLLILKQWIEVGLRITLNNPITTTWVIFTIILTAYTLQSPALGAELLKIGVALLAAIHITDQGRVIHLISKYAPETWNFQNFKFILKFKNVDASNPIHRVITHISKPLMNLLIFGVLIISIVIFIFNDLGGALISILMLITALFLGFGYFPSLFVLFLMGCGAVLLSFTSKVQSRIDLMLTPMHAAVSDFARLVTYTSASNPNGFGLGNLNWCNQENTCLPLQVLSDYMPVVLNGIGGSVFNLFIFLLLCTLFILLAGISGWRYIAYRGINRLSNLFIFFLLMGSLFQTILTFFGNWRLIPLTGVGTPMLSIGISSNLAISLAIGFFIISYQKSTVSKHK